MKKIYIHLKKCKHDNQWNLNPHLKTKQFDINAQKNLSFILIRKIAFTLNYVDTTT